MTTHCPIVLKTALNHIMILHDENMPILSRFQIEIGQISSLKATVSDKKKILHPWAQFSEYKQAYLGAPSTCPRVSPRYRSQAVQPVHVQTRFVVISFFFTLFQNIKSKSSLHHCSSLVIISNCGNIEFGLGNFRFVLISCYYTTSPDRCGVWMD